MHLWLGTVCDPVRRRIDYFRLLIYRGTRGKDQGRDPGGGSGGGVKGVKKTVKNNQHSMPYLLYLRRRCTTEATQY